VLAYGRQELLVMDLEKYLSFKLAILTTKRRK